MRFSSLSRAFVRGAAPWFALGLGLMLTAPACNEILGLCPEGTDGELRKACFLRACERENDDERCTVGPALAGAELQLIVRARDAEATDLRVLASRDDGVAVTLAGSEEMQSCFRAESQAQPSGDGGQDSLGSDECEWRGRLTTAEAGSVHVTVLDQNGTELDHSLIDVRRPERLETVVVRSAFARDLHDEGAEIVQPDAEGVYVVRNDARARDLYLVPTAYDVDGNALAAIDRAFEYTSMPADRVATNRIDNSPGVETDALLVPAAAGDATITITTRNADAPVSTAVKLRIEPN